LGQGREWSKAELIKYLTLYRNAAQRHSVATAEMARLQARLDAAHQAKLLHPRKPGRPPKNAPPPPDLAKLEQAVRAARKRVRDTWQQYRLLDDMEILPSRAARQIPLLLELLKTGQAETLAEALAFLDRQGR